MTSRSLANHPDAPDEPGLVAANEKSNEITAIPKLLEILEFTGCIVTIDAMGCQAEIAALIQDGHADSCLTIQGGVQGRHPGYYSRSIAP